MNTAGSQTIPLTLSLCFMSFLGRRWESTKTPGLNVWSGHVLVSNKWVHNPSGRTQAVRHTNIDYCFFKSSHWSSTMEEPTCVDQEINIKSILWWHLDETALSRYSALLQLLLKQTKDLRMLRDSISSVTWWTGFQTSLNPTLSIWSVLLNWWLESYNLEICEN